MACTNYTPLLSEVLQKLGKIKSKKDKVSYLKENNSEALRQVIKSSFDPKIKWALPYGEVPYVQKMDEKLKTSKSYPNFFTFISLGCIYFFRIILTIIRN